MTNISIQNPWRGKEEDIFGTDLKWDPNVRTETPKDFVMNRIAQELDIWSQQETFSFPCRRKPNYTPDTIFNVEAVTTLISVTDQFLTLAEKAEKWKVHGLYSAAVGDEDIKRSYLWTVLSDKNDGGAMANFRTIFLSENLAKLLGQYHGSRQALRQFVSGYLRILQGCPGAVSQSALANFVERLCTGIKMVRKSFEDWKAGARIEEIRKGYDLPIKPDKILSVPSLHTTLKNWRELLAQKIGANPPNFCPHKSRPPANPDEFHVLHFSPGDSLASPTRMELSMMKPKAPVPRGHLGSSTRNLSRNFSSGRRKRANPKLPVRVTKYSVSAPVSVPPQQGNNNSGQFLRGSGSMTTSSSPGSSGSVWGEWDVSRNNSWTNQSSPSPDWLGKDQPSSTGVLDVIPSGSPSTSSTSSNLTVRRPIRPWSTRQLTNYYNPCFDPKIPPGSQVSAGAFGSMCDQEEMTGLVQELASFQSELGLDEKQRLCMAQNVLALARMNL